MFVGGDSLCIFLRFYLRKSLLRRSVTLTLYDVGTLLGLEKYVDSSAKHRMLHKHVMPRGANQQVNHVTEVGLNQFHILALKRYLTDNQLNLSHKTIYIFCAYQSPQLDDISIKTVHALTRKFNQQVLHKPVRHLFIGKAKHIRTVFVTLYCQIAALVQCGCDILLAVAETLDVRLGGINAIREF